MGSPVLPLVLVNIRTGAAVNAPAAPFCAWGAIDRHLQSQALPSRREAENLGIKAYARIEMAAHDAGREPHLANVACRLEQRRWNDVWRLRLAHGEQRIERRRAWLARQLIPVNRPSEPREPT